MTQFEQATQSSVKCDICGEIMHPMYGGGWDNDRLICADRECGAEIVYPTSTEVPNAPRERGAVAHTLDGVVGSSDYVTKGA